MQVYEARAMYTLETMCNAQAPCKGKALIAQVKHPSIPHAPSSPGDFVQALAIRHLHPPRLVQLDLIGEKKALGFVR